MSDRQKIAATTRFGRDFDAETSALQQMFQERLNR